jgi:hypothetical protein
MEGILSKLDLGDKRLNVRCNWLIDQLAKRPASSIPQVCGSWKDTKAAYRFFENESVDPEKIFLAHKIEVKQKIKAEQGVILVPQDTTDCDYTTHKKTKGLGYLQGEKIFGIKVHTALALSEKGTPLGILSQKRWIRNIAEIGKRRIRTKRAMSEKESNRWITTLQDVASNIPSNKEVVVMGDREADLYELFATKRARNVHLLVRAKHNRHLGHGQQRLFRKVRLAKTVGTIPVMVQKTPKQKAREATVQVSYTRVTIPSPDRQAKVSLWVLAAEEMQPPKGEKAISWTLLTTVPILNFNQAVRVIGWYVKRWIIERFHYCLKSGCKIEELQLQEEKRLERAVAVYSIVAWRLLWMTYEAREHPDASYTEIMTDEEWDVLCTVSGSKKDTPKTIHEGVRMMAKLGGFLARKGDKEPGVKTLWIGMRRFTDIMIAWHVLKKKDVGKG